MNKAIANDPHINIYENYEGENNNFDDQFNKFIY